ncbi:primosomal protein N' [Leptothoe spongobia]|uniref:Replication restart protein PriA n=1 Tax=Leptothoe spongobia TAU-MAC 1115 TaxID=1967444 RepID=A0A947GLU7_9CYAN|nr:primosomal protein N' [Leptothoe spongobia]MBT9317247.1 primosomal protein N' [Leptothoe spongobia TAU-MAC 1115]
MSQSENSELSAFEGVEVLVDCPGIQGLYTYRIPKDFNVTPGDIVSVPFGGRQLGAIVIRLMSIVSMSTLNYTLRDIDSIVSQGFFSKDYWKLLERVANYYQTSLIQVIRTALPPGLLGRSQRRIRLRRSVDATALSSASDSLDLLKPSAQALLNALSQSSQGDYTWRYLKRQHKQATAGLDQLLSKGWVESYLAMVTPPKPQQRQAVSLTASSIPESAALTNRQQEILVTLQRCGGDLWLSDALQRLRTTSATLQRLAAKGYVIIEARERLRLGGHSPVLADQPKPLTPDQSRVLSVMTGLTGYAQVLLHGVTGSGKTEVYLQAIVRWLQAGKSVLVLVPEIGLTPQLTDRFRARFGEQVCVYHSNLSDGERYDTWRQMLNGQPQVVIGTRSAIFLPLPHLGMIVLDEEHDSSFKQDQPAPCYHTRTVARWRAEMADCPLVLGSATPALSTWVEVKDPNNIETFHGTSLYYLGLPNRVHQRPLPPVKVVDMRLELQAGNRSVFSRPLQMALEQMQTKGEQGLLFIHRRGHSRFVSCRSCGHVMDCPDCDVSLAYHQPQNEGPAHLRCHYCGYGQRHPDECPNCKSPYLKYFGSGTQRIVHELQSQFPGLRCLRFDSDTTRAKGAHRALLERFAAGEADVLVGTQMLTKGIDLPQITVVGVVAADGLLHMPDYWSGERAFQTLTQVAGRAGRGERPGQVILQTYTPEHPVIGAAKSHNYQAFIDYEIEHRQLLGYPPYGRLVLLRLTSPTEVEVEVAAQRCAEQLQAWLTSFGHAELADDWAGPSVLGPTPAPVFRVAKRYRWHVLLKLPLAMVVPDLTYLRSHLPKSVRLTIDIDPLNLS